MIGSCGREWCGCCWSMVASMGEDLLQSLGLQRNEWVFTNFEAIRRQRGAVCLHNHRWGLSCCALSKYCDKCPRGARTCNLPSSVRASFQLWEEEPILSEHKRLGTVAVPEVLCPVAPRASLGFMSPCPGGDPDAARLDEGVAGCSG